jgi:hypothetical protein
LSDDIRFFTVTDGSRLNEPGTICCCGDAHLIRQYVNNQHVIPLAYTTVCETV